jgi:hypothetical protein
MCSDPLAYRYILSAPSSEQQAWSRILIVSDMGSDPKGYGFDQLVVRKPLVEGGGDKAVKDFKGKTMGAVSSTARGSMPCGREQNLRLGNP